MVKDPICGKDVDPLRARAVGIFGGVTYYFCSAECKAQFKDPRQTPREPTREPTRDISTRGKPDEKPVEKKPADKVDKKAAEKKPDKRPAEPAQAAGGREPSLELAPLPEPSGPLDLPEPTPSAPHTPSPSVMEDVREIQSGSRRWALIVVILAVLVVVAAVLSLRH